MFDVSAAAKHLRKHPLLAEVVEAVGPIEFEPRRLPPFQSVTQSIIHQQLSGNDGELVGTLHKRRHPQVEGERSRKVQPGPYVLATAQVRYTAAAIVMPTSLRR
jgi:hypothetical protein